MLDSRWGTGPHAIRGTSIVRLESRAHGHPPPRLPASDAVPDTDKVVSHPDHGARRRALHLARCHRLDHRAAVLVHDLLFGSRGPRRVACRGPRRGLALILLRDRLDHRRWRTVAVVVSSGPRPLERGGSAGILSPRDLGVGNHQARSRIAARAGPPRPDGLLRSQLPADGPLEVAASWRPGPADPF